ncbi:hypothetical protein [Desulfopila inferna]|uniref:hypothetical protein n=1 Tax=Desulfopila inferna TaxID=468528 RepID=UPI0019660A1F|nr:hypothetical protein [Desulfopila inferna]MBM9604992.1 hypothetical protein [Desulfopila inferna]
MEAFLDTLWEYLAAAMQFVGQTLFALLQNLHFLGPLVVISLLALCTVAITKLLNRLIITKRYIMLEKEYRQWFELRQEAMKWEDREKGRKLARNIDQAELNRAYYDYFFEGFLLGIARKILPIFFVFAFINEFYRPSRMIEIFGRDYILQAGTSNGEPILIGAVFWYFISLIGGYLLWSVAARLLRNFGCEKHTSLYRQAEETNC